MSGRPQQARVVPFLLSIGFSFYESGNINIKGTRVKGGDYYKGDTLTDQQKDLLKLNFGEWVDFLVCAKTFAPELKSHLVVILTKAGLERRRNSQPKEEPPKAVFATITSATLTFSSRAAAQEFATAWRRYSLRGYDMSATKHDGVTRVTIYNLSEDDKKWVDAYVAKKVAES